MGRKRNEVNAKLPPGLRCRDGYYSYRHPVTGIEAGLGRSRRDAIAHAVATNIEAMATINQAKLKALQAEEQIVAAAVPMRALCGVYFLVKGCAVVYVGKSTNVHYRLGEHAGKGVYDFDRYHIIQCDPREVDELEALYIAKFAPKYNRELYLKLISPAPVYGRNVG